MQVLECRQAPDLFGWSEASSGQQAFIELRGVFGAFDAQEQQRAQYRTEDRCDQPAPLSELRGAHRVSRGEAADEQHAGVDGSKPRIQEEMGPVEDLWPG